MIDNPYDDEITKRMLDRQREYEMNHNCVGNTIMDSCGRIYRLPPRPEFERRKLPDILDYLKPGDVL